ncbi:MAG: tRNA-dihydrouridine synthase family protein [Clostridia bacterium]|nr:tRNA-dihydrouridine synthase family protein [Clostridia bacterium]
MELYFAPLEGVTDAIYRRVHRRHFSGASKYFMPFLSPSHSLTWSAKERFEMAPAQNAGVPVVPQILANRADYFNATARQLADFGYAEVNLNLGCPSGTVTAKGKGSGLLRTPDALRALLDRIFEKPLLPVSVKTRIGYQSADEWPRLLALLREYPFSELIVHPRTRQEFYNGQPHADACRLIEAPFVYNGDLFAAGDCRALANDFSNARALMLGRGLVANPALAQAVSGGEALTREALIAFHEDLYAEYARYWPETAVVGRMHLMMKYLCGCFENSDGPRRALRKATTPEAYYAAVRQLFEECPFKAEPRFDLDILLS